MSDVNSNIPTRRVTCEVVTNKIQQQSSVFFQRAEVGTKAISLNSVTGLFDMIGYSITGIEATSHSLLGGSPVADMSSNVAFKSDESIFELAGDIENTAGPSRLNESLTSTNSHDAESDTSATRTTLPSPAAAGSKSVTIGAGDRPLLIAELMPMASEMQPAVAPSEIVLDCVHMVFNNALLKTM